MPKYMPRRDFLAVVEIFKYHLTPEAHLEFVEEFLGNSPK